VQLLVNNLALTGLWISTFSFLLVIGAGLTLTLVVKYAQMILNEYLQRHLLNRELNRWRKMVPKANQSSPYFLESFNILKGFAFILAEGFDLLLKCVFGAIALIFIHPAFLMVSLLFVGFLILIRWRGRNAIVSSIIESDRKYDLFDALDDDGGGAFDRLTVEYFRERDTHFGYLRRQAVVTFVAHFSLQLLLLGWGIHLIQINQLSLGQLISAEIIVSNIFGGLGGLPKILETFYDYETSCYKLEAAKEEEPA
jgi:putative ABC transport system ATP-binding protein